MEIQGAFTAALSLKMLGTQKKERVKIWPWGEESEQYTGAQWSLLLEPQPLHRPPLGVVR